jgi:acetolactate synthase-1/2/3 large subunit
MAELTGGQLVAKILKEEGVEFVSGVHGGHVWPIMMAINEQGIKFLHLRHEQTGPYISDGWGRVTGRPGVCLGTAGPGMYNQVPGLAHAFLTRSPVVSFVGQHESFHDGWAPFQEGYAEDVCRSFTKWTKRITDIRTISYYVQKAFRDVVAYPPGPVVIEIPQNVVWGMGSDENQEGYISKENCAELGKPEGNAILVEKAVRMLLKAERPVVIGGDGIYWSGASEELKEFVEMLSIPVHTRRMGRGAVPESHPLAFTGAYRRPILNRADVISTFGLRMSFLEHFGQPPTYSHDAKYILVSESLEELDARLPTDIRLLANPKLVLKQMIDCAKDLIKNKPDRTEWITEVRKAEEDYLKEKQQKPAEQIEAVRNAKPINPHFLAHEVVNFLDDSATVILDSFSMSGFTTDKIKANYAGQILDAATDGGVGHSVGMGIGAQLGRPGKQILSLLGDGGLGISGFDIETAARHNIPVVYLLFNNSGWISPTLEKEELPNMPPWTMLKDIRYDIIFEQMGCHTELLTEPEQIRPALERAFTSGKTSVINVIPDDSVFPEELRKRIRERQKRHQ